MWGSWIKVWDVGCKVWGIVVSVWRVACRVQSSWLGYEIWGLRFWGLWCRVQCLVSDLEGSRFRV